MKTLKNIFNFYINGSIHVAFAVAALVKLTFLKFSISEGNTYLYFSFFGTILAYNFVKYAGISALYHKHLTRFMTAIKVLTVVCGLLFLYFGYVLSIEVLLYMAPFVGLTVLYAIPVFPEKKNLRSVAGIKIFIIGLTWAGTTVFVPVMYAESSIGTDMIIEIIQRFLFIIVMMLPFEIRDLKYDSSNLETIPQRIGITKTKVFGSIVLLFFLLLEATKDELSSVEILSMVSITIISLFFLWATEKKQSPYFCSFWVESIPILWLGVFMLFQSLSG